MHRSQRLTIFLSILIVSAIVSCNRQRSEWRGSVVEVDGVTIVKNPSEPLYGEDVLEFREELTIGVAEGDEEYMFQMLNDVEADEQGNIYVVEGRLALIRVYDENGGYLRSIGRKGQGPGEMQMPIYVQITTQDEVLVHDYPGQRLSYFSLDGTFLRQKSTASTGSPFVPIRMDPQGNLTTIAAFAPQPMGGKQLRFFNADLELVSMIAKEERDMRKTFDIGKPTWFCDVFPSGQIVWGDSQEYILNILNNDCTLIRRISKEHDPLEISGEDRASYREFYAASLERGLKIQFRSHYPAFGDINVDDEGRIFVRTFEKVEDTENWYYHDVFDAEGRYIAKVPITVNMSRISEWKNNKFYTTETDDEGYQVVKRYEVVWKM
jgi:hypothetical protein